MNTYTMRLLWGRRCAAFLLAVLLVFSVSGCATKPYRIGSPINYIEGYVMPEGEPQIVYGRPNGFLDASGWIWPGSLMSKLILWNYKVDSHKISPETVEILEEYLDLNDLRNVKVRINAYSVRDEWRRTFRNKAVGAGWRYTLGFWSWLMYTIMPQRFFGGDNYNPYSNTINIYSDIPAILLHEAGHAKDFTKREWKGTYAFMYMLPFFALYPEALATSDALGYLRAYQPLLLQKQGYNVLFPAYGTYIGGNIGQWIAYPWNYAAYAAGVIPGHIVGRIRSATLPDPEE
ncbi:MAG: hypothetical protein EOM20_13645 [Spartobacteria bacterium]|nr:hypothetical protein [Spartobacteria bacterium]